jgi:hypothetical protein
VQLALVVIVKNAASSGEEGWGLSTLVHLDILRRKGRGFYLMNGAGCSTKGLYMNEEWYLL